MSLSVETPGAQLTVQDAGRPGWAHLGVGRSGAADRGGAARANRLVGNVAGAAVLEALLGGCVLRTDRAAVVALTGAGAALTVDGRPHPAGRPVRWPAGATLTLGTATAGLRCYLAVRGGVEVPAVLGSRSTDTLGGIGPAPLVAGAELGVGAAVSGPPAAHEVVEAPPPPRLLLDARPGPRVDWFDAAGLVRTGWLVGTDLDRVGTRLVGPALARRREDELPSEGIVRGAVQIPPSGLPTVFGADHPTTGGYPVVAVLTERASDAFAQARPGTRVRFRVQGAAGGLAMMGP